MTDKRKLASLLTEAWEMERKTIDILEARADRIRNHPGVVERFKKHLKESSWQIAQLETCLKQLGFDGPLHEGSAIAEVGALLASGDVIRSSTANSAFERFEMAVYSRLGEMAKQSGEHEIARICYTIMRQEEFMAEWLEEHLAQTPLVYLMFDEIDTTVGEDDTGPHVAAGPLH